MVDPVSAIAFSMFENRGVYALLLGSGVSRAAQIPTGWDITLDLTRKLAALEGTTDQPDWAAWHVERFGEAPSYSKVLDALSKTSAERRSILHGYIEPSGDDLETGARLPTPAHRAIAWMVREGFVRVIVTTNFDRLLENALREVGVEPTVVKSEDDLAGSVPLVHARCYVLKVHGDYLDTRLRNTDAELESYGAPQNQLLDRIFDEHGLIVCGWSAEWDLALRDALKRAPSRRYPTYWAAQGVPGPAAADLIQHRAANVVPIGSADDFMNDLTEKLKTLLETSRPDPRSVDLTVGSAKRYLARSEHRILLGDLLKREVTRAKELTSNLKPDGRWSEAEFRRRVAKYEAHFEAVGRIGIVMGRWGTGDEVPLASDILDSLLQVSRHNGLVAWLKLGSYPAALFFSAYALGATKAGRLATLRKWLARPVTAPQGRDDKAAFEVLFGEMFQDGEQDMWALLAPSRDKRASFNEHVLEVLQDWSSDVFVERKDVEICFDWLELLVGAEMTCARIERDHLERLLARNDGRSDHVWSTLGRFAGHYENQDRLLGRMVREPTASELLSAGFAAGDRRMLELLEQNFRRVLARRW